MTIILFAVLAAFCECNMFNDLVHDDQVVAKACGEKLGIEVKVEIVKISRLPVIKSFII